MRPVILDVGNRRFIVSGEIAAQYAEVGGVWASREVVHVHDGEHVLLDSSSKCPKCRGNRPCAVRKLSVLYAKPKHIRSTALAYARGALTARDTEGNVDGRLGHKNRVWFYNHLEDGRPACLPLQYSWSRVNQLVRTSTGLCTQWRLMLRGEADQLYPKGKVVYVAFRPKSDPNLRLVQAYLDWITESESNLTTGTPPAEIFCPATGGLKSATTDADLVRFTANREKRRHVRARRPQSISQLWLQLGTRIFSEWHNRPDLITPSELQIMVLTRILRQYLKSK